MKKSTKVWIIVGTAMMLIGAVIAFAGFGLGGSSWLYLSKQGITVPTKMHRTELTDIPLESFHSMDLDISYYTVKFVPSNKNALDIVYYRENSKPEYQVKNATLTIRADETMKGINIGMMFSTTDYTNQLTIYYDQNVDLEQLQLKLRYCDLNLSQLSAASLNLQTDYTDVQMSGNTFGDFVIKNSYGDYHIDKAIIDGTFQITSRYSDFKIVDTTTGSFDVDSDYTDFNCTRCTVLTATEFKSGYGEIDYSGNLYGKTTISADYSDFELNLEDKDYGYELHAKYGDIEVNDKNMSEHAESALSAANFIWADISYGDLVLDFAQH